MKTLPILVTIILITSSALALDFAKVGGTFSMNGEIKKDDSVNFLLELANWEAPPTVFHIDSPGGDLDVAMEIGEIIRESQIPVWSGEECSSACVFIFVSGVERIARGEIGLHRPYFNKAYFSDLSSTEARDKYEQLKESSIDYLVKMGVTQQIIDRMFATGSTEIDTLNSEEAKKIFGFRLPFYEEWLTAKCGKYTDDQAKVIKSLGALKAARATILVSQNQDIPKTDDFGDNLKQLIKEAKLAFEMEKAGMLDPYIEISEIHKKCEEKAANTHIYNFHYSIKKYLEDLTKESMPNPKMKADD